MKDRQLRLLIEGAEPSITMTLSPLLNARTDDPPESKQAATANGAARQRMRDEIFDCLSRHPATRAELQDDLHPRLGWVDRSIISRRLTDLMNDGLVERTPLRRQTSIGASGSVFALSRRGEHLAAVEARADASRHDGAEGDAYAPSAPISTEGE